MGREGAGGIDGKRGCNLIIATGCFTPWFILDHGFKKIRSSNQIAPNFQGLSEAQKQS
jgi:hypothetical protein